MHQIIRLILLAVLVLAQPAVLTAQDDWRSSPDRVFGIGLMLGEPTGVNAKYGLSEVSAIDGFLGISFEGDNEFTTHVDYLYHLNDLFDVGGHRFTVYFGGGPRFKVREQGDDLFGLRTVGGVAYLLEEAPIDLFVEAGPVFDFTPDFEVRYTFALGARFWF